MRVESTKPVSSTRAIVVNIMIRQREPKTRIGGLCVKHEVARAMLFCAIQQNADGRNFSFRNSPQCPI